MKHIKIKGIDYIASSLPSWERGLKHDSSGKMKPLSEVAPFVGAWIETLLRLFYNEHCASLPSWERGLKQISNVCGVLIKLSLPSWERGLKHRHWH